MLDVGQGDAFFIEMPTGERVLIDGGRDRSVLSKLGTILPPWDRRIDVLIPSHPDADHITGLVESIDRYQVGLIIETGVQAHTPVGDAFAAIDAPRRFLSAGDIITFGRVTLEALWPQEGLARTYPENRNDTSLVLRLDYGRTSMLFTGDAENTVEAVLADAIGHIDVLKVGHHGSLSSTSWELLVGSTPDYALVSAGEDNSYGHPHPVILSRLKSVGAQIFRTDTQGDILLTSYGGEPTVVAHPLPF